MSPADWAPKPWDMIVAEVEVLSLGLLVTEARIWLDIQAYVTEANESWVRRNVEGAIDDLTPDDVQGANDDLKPDDANPLALQRVRNWCTHNRHAHEGRTPAEIPVP